jgi:hypothetical protein
VTGEWFSLRSFLFFHQGPQECKQLTSLQDGFSTEESFLGLGGYKLMCCVHGSDSPSDDELV